MNELEDVANFDDIMYDYAKSISDYYALAHYALICMTITRCLTKIAQEKGKLQ